MKFKISELVDFNLESIKKNDELDEIHYLDTANLTEGVFEEIKKYNWKEDKVPSRARRRVKENDILVSTVRPNQKHYGFITAKEQEFIVSTGFAVITPNTNKVDPYYLYQYLTLDKTTNYLQMIAENSTSAYPSIKPKDIGNLEIELPDLNKQKQIGKFLWDINKKIHLNSSIITNLEELAQTLFRHWFVDFEFPNEEGKPYKSSGGKMVESELGMIPEGWNLNKLNEISKLIMGLSPKSSTYNEEGEGLPLLNGAADFNGSSLAPKRYTSDPKRISIKSDLILCIRATIGNLTYSDSEYALGRGVAAIRPYKREYSELLYHFVLRSINRLKAQATGSVISGLSKPDLENIIILVPDDKKLNKFHNVFSSIQLKQQQLSEENIRLVNIRDTLLPKLLSGEVELPDDMEVTDDVPVS